MNENIVLSLTPKDYKMLYDLPSFAYGYLTSENDFKKVGNKLIKSSILTFKTHNQRDDFQNFLRKYQISSRKLSNADNALGRRKTNNEKWSARLKLSSAAMDKIIKHFDLPETDNNDDLERYLNIFANYNIKDVRVNVMKPIDLYGDRQAVLYELVDNGPVRLKFRHKSTEPSPYRLSVRNSDNFISTEDLADNIMVNFKTYGTATEINHTIHQYQADLKIIKRAITDFHRSKNVTRYGELPF